MSADVGEQTLTVKIVGDIGAETSTRSPVTPNTKLEEQCKAGSGYERHWRVAERNTH